MTNAMLIMAAHEMRSLAQAVTGTVDTTYVPDWIANGDPRYPVRIAGGSASLAIALAAGIVNGLVVVNHNLVAGTVVTFSGLGTVTAPTVPVGNIRANAYDFFTDVVAPGSTTLTISGHPTDIVIGDVFVGRFREVWPLPTETAFPYEGVQIRPAGEFHGLSFSKGAEAFAPFGNTIYLTDTDYAILRDAYLASEENSKPTIVVLYDDSTFDLAPPIAVTWELWQPKPIRDDLWAVDLQWRELPRYRWAA